jgi:hemolysin activation/secretion protein
MLSGFHAAALAAVLAACTLPLVVKAQSLTPAELQNAARQGEQFLRQQQELQEAHQQERDRSNQRPGGEDLQQSSGASGSGSDQGKCVDTNSLELVGARLLSKEQVVGLQSTVAGHCMGAKEINALLRRITDLYVSKGYVTTRAYIPAQKWQSGRLTIVVIEGKVERIDVQPKGSASAATAFPGMTGKVFNLRDAEQGIDQLNRLPTNNAKLDILPGSTAGSSVIEIVNEPRRRLTGSLSTDDTGSAATGLWQGTASLAADDPLRLNDGLLVSYTHSIDGPSPGPAWSRATAVSYSVPYGWWTGNFLFTESDYESVAKGNARDIDTSGTNRNYTLRLDRVAYRDKKAKLTLYADLTRRETDNFVAGQLIGTSSRVLTLADLSANLSLAEGATLWSFDAGLSRGVRWLGGFHDPNGLPGNAPRGDFLKSTGSVGVSRGFAPFGLRTQLSSTLSVQWTNDVLYPSEQIAITGPFAVRGYRDTNLFGDRGYTWRNEVGFPFTIAPRGTTHVDVRPYIGADSGQVWAHDNLPGGYLTSGTVGATFSTSAVSLDLSWSGSAARSHSLAADHYFFARLAARF